MSYFALAYYQFVPIEEPHEEIRKQKEFFENRTVTARIYLSEEGINGQLSASQEDARAYMSWLRSDPRFASISFKIHPLEEQIFPRLTVKYRKQLVALDDSLDTSDVGTHLSPKAWREMLEGEEEILLLDVRNDYESKIGHFEGARLPPLEQFRDFPDYAEKLKSEVDLENTKVLMYCTGGIRCELYSALMKKKGFKQVYQLEGGILNYGLKEGGAHWKGKCFVFDDRLAISIDGKENIPISECHHCGKPNDTYYNCANMDCNALFLACAECVEEHQGCCSTHCMHGERVRPFEARQGNKPFRRKHLIDQPADESALKSAALSEA